ncbi:hypothetical protein [Sphingomonas montana]|uniref:hypothetical protein n=1 Tax=Sphingomonas montana TaxID=1843236 RepID=UPI00101AE2E4|nr:hypothetical protein [Sphingomonas montana]
MDMPGTNVLAGRTVLIVHEDAFQAAYLDKVLRGSGAKIRGVAQTAADGVQLLEAGDPPVGVIVSRTVTGYEAEELSDILAARAVVVLTVHPAGGTAVSSGAGRCALVAPYAGFQVVDALAQLFAETDGVPVDTVRPGR